MKKFAFPLKFPLQATEFIRSQGAPPLKNDKKWSKEFKDFLASCLIMDPNNRATVKQLLAHPFVKLDKREKLYRIPE